MSGPIKLYRNALVGMLMYINPWLYFGFILNNKTVKLILNKRNLLLIIILLICSSISLIHTHNLNILFQLIGLILFATINVTISLKSKVSFITLIRAYLLFGVIYSSFIYLFTGSRIGIYGNEANFTGFTMLTSLIFMLNLQKLKLIDILLVLIMILLTASRAFLLMSIILILLYKFRNRQFILILGVLICYISVFYILRTFNNSELPFIESTGYVDDVKRLYQFNDSSTRQRFDLINNYLNYLSKNSLDLIFGTKIETKFGGLTLEPHNSVLQKIYEYGLIHTAILIYIMFKRLPRWIFAFFMLYGLFLHNLLTLPLFVIFLSQFKNSTNNLLLSKSQFPC